VFKEFVERLQEIGGLSHIIVIYLFHEPQGYRLLVKTPSDDILHGLFATRPPYRPCPLGLTAVELGTGEKNLLKVKGLDGADTNPLLDVKPCAAAVAKTSALKSGWQEGKLGREEC
jgi:tRNA-Thr(GGU) m(6)t(6)A37 methyltransferase TsaA